ncbi:23S rRNA (pseudouridine(1915)-N(3))-methyltransferase RlmH [Candidatus Woesearchaeota archaeon]|nr:23S rRNA (pseudouridine(1915)-N(3))-methyltransferase RlmH [Candidatus Woesearchaeota archaeon]
MITILSIGEVKDKNTVSLIQEYLKRLSNERILLQSVKEEKATNDSEAVKKKEGERLLEKVEKQEKNTSTSLIIALAEEGKTMNSISFAEFLKKNQEKNIVFVIGGAYGLHETVKKKAHLLLSLSPMTFPHEIALLLLVEQIYRAMMINSGRKYQK